MLAARNTALRLSEVLNRLMSEFKIDGVKLSRNTGVPVTTINRLRKADPANNPTLTTLVPLAEYFSITVSQLIGDEAISVSAQPARVTWKSIPHLSFEQTVKWLGNKDLLAISDLQWTTTDLGLSENAFAVTVQGDSMSPQFPEGTLLIFEPNLCAHNRDFVLVLPRGQSKPLFKQMLIDGPDHYIKSLHFDFKEIKTIELGQDHVLLGVMVQARVEYRKVLEVSLA